MTVYAKFQNIFYYSSSPDGQQRGEQTVDVNGISIQYSAQGEYIVQPSSEAAPNPNELNTDNTDTDLIPRFSGGFDTGGGIQTYLYETASYVGTTTAAVPVEQSITPPNYSDTIYYSEFFYSPLPAKSMLSVLPLTGSGTLKLEQDTSGNLVTASSSGSFTYTDSDVTANPVATANTNAAVVTATDPNGNALNLTLAQEASLRAAFSIDQLPNDGNGYVNWNYNTSGSQFNFIGLGETVEVTEPIQITDDDGSEVDPSVTIQLAGPYPTKEATEGADLANKVIGYTQNFVEFAGALAVKFGYSNAVGKKLLLEQMSNVNAILGLGISTVGIGIDLTNNLSLPGSMSKYNAYQIAVSAFGNEAIKAIFVANMSAVVSAIGDAAVATLAEGGATAIVASSEFAVGTAILGTGALASTPALIAAVAAIGAGIAVDKAYDAFIAPYVKQVFAQDFKQIFSATPTVIPVSSYDSVIPSYSVQIVAPSASDSTAYALDPFGHGTYVIAPAAGSPAIATVTLPASSAANYAVTFSQSDGTSSAAQTIEALQQINVPTGTSSIQVQMLNADGSVDTNPSDLSFVVTFASAGTANLTVNAPTPGKISHSSPLYVSQLQASQTGEVTAGATVILKLNMSEAVTVDTSAGSPTLTLDDGATATYDTQASNPGQGELAFDYAVSAGDTSPNLYVNQVNLNGATVTDANGNAPDFEDALYTPTGLQVGPAAIASIEATPQTTVATTGQTLKLTVGMSQGLALNTASGAPTLSLSDGATATYDTGASSPSSGVLVFDDTIGGGDYAVGLTTTALNLNGATLTDANGVAADLSAASGFSLLLDVNAAVVTSFAASQTGPVAAGAAVTLALATSEAVAVNTTGGTPTLTVDDGATATYDAQASDPGQGSLIFDYTVGAGDQSPNLEAVAVNLNGATIDDANGNPADLSNALYNPTGLAVGEPVCFAAGTRICVWRDGSTADVAVERLAVGDLAVTASGAHRPIRWLGHRTIDPRYHPRPHDGHPVRIAAHAFGEKRPARDLFVSPGHAICIDVLGEVLIPAGSLVNGTTVQQVEVDEVTYWHVELDSHDILLADNLPAESYLDVGNRGFFVEQGVVSLAASPDAAMRTHADFCRPFHSEGALVDTVRLQLDRRAMAMGARDDMKPAGKELESVEAA